MDLILQVMGPPAYRNIQDHNVACFCLSFPQLILIHFIIEKEKTPFASSHKSKSPTMVNKVITRLEINPDYVNNNPAVLTDFFKACLGIFILKIKGELR